MVRYWLTPPELEPYRHGRYDPCPYPRARFDGLEVEWGKPWYCNPPFLSKDGGGIEKWIRKAAAEGGPGRMILPTLWSVTVLLKHGFKLEYCPPVHWLEADTLEPCKHAGPVLWAVLGDG